MHTPEPWKIEHDDPDKAIKALVNAAESVCVNCDDIVHGLRVLGFVLVPFLGGGEDED